MWNVSWLSEYDHFIGTLYGVAVLLGLGFTLRGIWLLSQPRLRPRVTVTLERRLGLTDIADGVARYEVFTMVLRIGAWRQIFSGIGLMSGVALWSIVSLFVRGDLLLLGLNWTVIVTIGCIGMLMNFLGHAYGIRRLRAQTTTELRYGDLSPRRLSDYRPYWTFIFFFGFVLGVWAITGFVLATDHHPFQVTLVGGLVLTQPLLPTWLWLSLFPFLMGFTLTLTEVLARWMVALPRLNFPGALPNIDEIEYRFRRESISIYQALGSNILLICAVDQFTLLYDHQLGSVSAKIVSSGAAFLAVCYLVYIIIATLYYQQTVPRSSPYTPPLRVEP